MLTATICIAAILISWITWVFKPTAVRGQVAFWAIAIPLIVVTVQDGQQRAKEMADLRNTFVEHVSAGKNTLPPAVVPSQAVTQPPVVTPKTESTSVLTAESGLPIIGFDPLQPDCLATFSCSEFPKDLLGLTEDRIGASAEVSLNGLITNSGLTQDPLSGLVVNGGLTNSRSGLTINGLTDPLAFSPTLLDCSPTLSCTSTPDFRIRTIDFEPSR